MIFKPNLISYTLDKFCLSERFLSAALLVMGLLIFVNRTKAQSGSDNVTINLKFRPVQTIVVTPAQKTTDILYASINDHQNGITVMHDNHLTVFSTGGFLISVEASNENFTRIGGTETIPVSDVVIKAANSMGNDAYSEFSDVTLSTVPTPLVTSNSGGRDLKYNIIYDNTIAGSANQYINKYISPDKPETIYTSQVTYTITTH